MTTLRRELRKALQDKLIVSDVYASACCNWEEKGVSKDAIDGWTNALLDAQADAALELRAFKTPTARIDRTEQEWDELGDKKMVAMIESAQEGGKIKDALIVFEAAFGFGRLPWDTTATWQKFAKFVRKIHESTPTAFGEYIVWRGTAGKYSGYSNKKIRENPQAFMDTGWPEFEKQNQPKASNLEMPKDGSGFYA